MSVGTYLSPYFGLVAFLVWFGAFFWYFYGGAKIKWKIQLFLSKLRLAEHPHEANKRRMHEEAVKRYEENERLKRAHQEELDAIGRPPTAG